MAALVRDGFGLLALVALFMMLVNLSERRAPRWLRRRGFPPPLYVETKEGRERLTRLMRARSRRSRADDHCGGGSESGVP
jgi:hypothetical protein